MNEESDRWVEDYSAFILDDPRVGSLQPTTKDGITIIHALDLGESYELINGEWVLTEKERIPF